MADLTQNQTPAVAGPPEVCFIKEPFGPAGSNAPDPNGSTGIVIYAGATCGWTTTGTVDNIDSTTSTIVTVAGVSKAYHNGTAGAPPGTTLANIPLQKGAVQRVCDGTVTATLPYGTDLYAVDNQTVSADPGAGRIRVGFFEGMALGGAAASCFVQIGQASPLATAGAVGGSARPNYARAVMTTTAVASYTGSGTGVLTAGSNAALVAQDGVTLAVGDVIMLQGGTLGSLAITAKDTGPWQVTSLGSASTPFVLTRPSWYQNGAIVPTALRVDLGTEGTLFGGTTWSSWATPGTVIGTTDPAFYPDRVVQSVALAASTTTVTNVPIRSATKSAVQASFVAAGGSTTSTIGYGVIAAPTPGYIGTASAVVDALASGMGKNGAADTSTVAIVIVNR